MTAGALRKAATAAIAAAWLAGCAAEPPAESPAATDTRIVLSTETLRVAREVGDCPEPDAPGCTRIEVVYPVFTAEPDAPIEAALNRLVRTLVVEPAYGPDPEPSVDSLVQGFIDDYLALLDDMPDYPHGWTDQREVSVLLIDERIVSLRRTQQAWTGGAHPNSSTRYVSLDRESGLPLSLDNTFPAAALPALSALLERALRHERDLPADRSLDALGFAFEGESLPVPDNFALTENGVVFHYDAYEIAPYAMGPTTLRLDRAEFAALAVPDSPLREP